MSKENSDIPLIIVNDSTNNDEIKSRFIEIANILKTDYYGPLPKYDAVNINYDPDIWVEGDDELTLE